METRENHTGFWQTLRAPAAVIMTVGALSTAFWFQGSLATDEKPAQIVEVPEGANPYPVQENFGNSGVPTVGIGVEAEDRELIRDIDCGGGKKDAMIQDNGDWLVICQQSIRKSGFILKLLEN